MKEAVGDERGGDSWSEVRRSLRLQVAALGNGDAWPCSS